MTKEEVLAKSRQENKDRDLYELSVAKGANHVGVVAMYAVVLLLTVIHVMQTGSLNLMLWIVALSVDSAMGIYKAFKLRTKQSIIAAIVLLIADAAVTAFLFRDMI